MIIPNKKAWTIGQGIIALIILGMTMAVLATVWGGVVSDYDVPNTDNISEQYNKTLALAAMGEETFGSIENINKTGTIDNVEAMVKGGYSVIRIGLGSFDYIRSMIWQIAHDIHIPRWFVLGIIGAILIYLSFELAAVIFKLRR